MRPTILSLAALAACSFGLDQADADQDGTEGSTGLTIAGELPPSSDGSSSSSSIGAGASGDGSSDAGDGSSSSTGLEDAGDGSSSSTGLEDAGDGSSSSTGLEDDPTVYADCYDAEGVKLCEGSCVLDLRGDLSACAPDCGGPCPEGGACLSDLADGIAAPVCVLPCSSGDECPGDVCGETTYTQDGAPLLVCMWS